MNALYREYSARGVKFIGINSNATEPAQEVASHAAKHGFGFTVYKDINNVVADRFGAQVTPEVFVVDRNGVIAYHGAIDDSQNPANVKTQGLKLALDALLAGRPVEKASTKAFGCTIKRARTAS
jgi:peroxiredoxin